MKKKLFGLGAAVLVVTVAALVRLGRKASHEGQSTSSIARTALTRTRESSARAVNQTRDVTGRVVRRVRGIDESPDATDTNSLDSPRLD